MIDNKSIFIVGAKGQLGIALQEQYPGAIGADIDRIDITDQASVENFDWSGIKYILNAAAYTNVEGAESTEGRVSAWKVNATAVGHLVSIASKHNITLVHISSDYVFDGTKDPHTEDEDLSPLSVYGQSKAAGDLLISQAPKYYLIRTSWVIGNGKNFVKTMYEIGGRGISPKVVDDQIGRLTFTSTLAAAIDHLLVSNAPSGIYNVSNDGSSASWAEIATEVFAIAGYDLEVQKTTTAEYYEDQPNAAERPLLSTLSLKKIKNSSFQPTDWRQDLKKYIEEEKGL